ncbi:putative 2-hydroxy-3-oxopropionate reductase [Helianthus anomalus]
MKSPYSTPITPSQTQIGWIGTGVMGAAMASRLLSAGYSLTIYARTPSKTLSLQSQGARLVHSPSEVAKASDVIFTMLGHPPDVRQIVLENPDSILSSITPGSVIIDHTSSLPVLAKQIYDAAREKDCWAVDAPVSGGDIGARDGKLAILAGGDEAVVKWLTPLLSLMGKPNYMGGAGCGQSCKIANQITVGGSLLGLSEGLVFAEAAGLDKAQWLEAVRGGAAGSMVMEIFGERMIGRDFRPGGFAEYMVKDLGMGLDVVEEDGEKVAVLPGAGLSKQLFSGMVANGDGKLGTQGLITVIERINGKRTPNPV